MSVRGKISYFGDIPGKFNDPIAGSVTASGVSTTVPGISLYNRKTLGGFWRVRMPNGRTAVLRQTDIGPAPWTGRKFDFTTSSLRKLGYSPGNFPTDATITAQYLGKNPGAQRAYRSFVKGGQAAQQGPKAPGKLVRGPGTSVSIPGPVSETARRDLILQFLQNRQRPGSVLQLALGMQNLPSDPSTTVNIPGRLRKVAGPAQKPVNAPQTPSGPKPKGLTQFDGKPVAAWIAPILQYARQHGWKGSLNSGYRTPAEQIAAATRYGLQHYPNGPLASNHVHGGAVDVSAAQQLNSIIQRSPYRGRLVWGGPVMGDWVHFSANGH